MKPEKLFTFLVIGALGVSFAWADNVRVREVKDVQKAIEAFGIQNYVPESSVNSGDLVKSAQKAGQQEAKNSRVRRGQGRDRMGESRDVRDRRDLGNGGAGDKLRDRVHGGGDVRGSDHQGDQIHD